MAFGITDKFYGLSLDVKTQDYPTPIFNFSPGSEEKLRIMEDIPTPKLDYSKERKNKIPDLVLDDSSFRQKKRKYSRSIYDKDDEEEISPDNSPIFGILKRFSDKKRKVNKENKKVDLKY